MISIATAVLPTVLLAAALYWAFRNPTGQRPAGTLSMAALLASFAVACGSAFQPQIRALEDAVTLDLSKLVGNVATLAAALCVSSVLLHLNHDTADARRQLRLRAWLLAPVLTVMAVAFAITPDTDAWSAQTTAEDWTQAPASLHIYDLAFAAYLAYAVYDAFRQTWKRSGSARRISQRVGLRTTAVGCGLALVYTAYKIVNSGAPLFDWDPFPGGACTSLVTPTRCVFSKTTPALGIVLITAGLTMPAVIWSFTQLRLRRWERRCIADLAPLWVDITSTLPDVVLGAELTKEPGYALRRRVIEISDGIVSLRAFRSPAAREAAELAVAQENLIDPAHKDAIVEAAVLAVALRNKRENRAPSPVPHPSAADATVGTGDLRATAEWLRSVARAYASSDIVRTALRTVPQEAAQERT